ncbi:vesicular integral-membrane protein VIP36-like [Actinia tenebrosa]|uniref:Vesicular integral-membrane protein VIP36-like n=1 Tax=Actinia tenebrosa TaxID=6105 RepID=A0A6P8I771_ACTTE|nr:vesicular integral-membrane protein VIP36-like [Actinia tenebrosa]
MAQCTLNQIYLIFTSFLLLCTELLADPEAQGSYLKREHSLMKPYQGAGMTIPDWDLGGNTFVSNDYIRLTPDHQSKRGSLWNNIPCYLHNWEMLIHFSVHGQGTTMFGDGFAFWYARDRLREGPAFGSQSNFYGLGVFFDTYNNHNGEHSHEHPYISAMIGNGSNAYDHDRDGTHNQVEGCSAQFRGQEHETFAIVRYLGAKERLTVLTDVDGRGEWRECFDVRGVKLPTGLYFGVSAATGELADNHDIKSMKLFEVEVPEGDEKKAGDEVDLTQIVPFADGAEKYRDHIDDPKGSFSTRTSKIFTWLFWFAVIVCILCGVGFYFYQKQQVDARKRFY